MGFGISLHPSGLPPQSTANPDHTKVGLTRSKEMVKAWSQDFSATCPHAVWPTTRLSTFSTASTSPAVPRLGLRACLERGPYPAPPYSLASSPPPRSCLDLVRSQPSEGLPARTAMGERPGTAISSCSQPRRRTCRVPGRELGGHLVRSHRHMAVGPLRDATCSTRVRVRIS